MTPVYCKTPLDQAKVLEAIGSKEKPIARLDMVLLIDGDLLSFTHLSDLDEPAISSNEFLTTQDGFWKRVWKRLINLK